MGDGILKIWSGLVSRLDSRDYALFLRVREFGTKLSRISILRKKPFVFGYVGILSLCRINHLVGMDSSRFSLGFVAVWVGDLVMVAQLELIL